VNKGDKQQINSIYSNYH